MTRDAVALPALGADDFPAGTALHAFFAWNEGRRRPDRRYRIARDLYYLYRRFGETGAGTAACVAHLAVRPLIRRRAGQPVVVASAAAEISAALANSCSAVAERLVGALLASIGSTAAEKHAAVFRAFEKLSGRIDLDALARRRPRRLTRSRPPGPRRILVIKLSALGDFVQALGPAAAIRQHHLTDEITLLTTAVFSELARQSGCFDRIVLDRRPQPLDLAGWLTLRRALCNGRFDRVYDLQTSERSSFYSWLFLPGRRPEWSGVAWRCSHPHANLERDPQHTIEKQAEQLLMAGIYPTPLPVCSASSRPLPQELERGAYFLLIPGSSRRHPEKRWPAGSYGTLAQHLLAATGLRPVIVGAAGEEPLAAQIGAACPAALDLVGRTRLTTLVDLAAAAVFSIGNDTGATHIAAAAGNPVIVLFSDASDPSRCAPRGREVRVLSCLTLEMLSIDRVYTEAIGVYDSIAHATAADMWSERPR